MSDSKTAQIELFQLMHTIGGVEPLFQMLDGPVSDEDSEVIRDCIRSVKSIVIEREYIDKDYRSAYSGYYSKKFSRSSSRAIRIHLFDVLMQLDDLHCSSANRGLAGRLLQRAKHTKNAVDAEGTTAGYVGYIVLRPTEYSRIGRCLLDPRKLGVLKHVKGHLCLTKYSAEILGHKLEVSAFPHQSQDAEVHICAHTAIWSLFRYLSQRYRQYREQSPYDVALLNKDLHHGRPLPGRGLYMDQVTAMFGEFGLAAEIYEIDLIEDILGHEGSGWAEVQPLTGTSGTKAQANAILRRRDRDNFLHLLHVHIDAGIPPVVGIPGHALVAVGFEYSDTPQVQRPGRIISSSDFVKALIVNDDNFAPYQRVARKKLKGSTGVRYSALDADTFVVPLPEKIFLTAEKAEILITDLLGNCPLPFPQSGRWSPTVSKRRERFVRRLYCTSSKNYRSFRRRDTDSVSAELLCHPLPHFMWICEFSPWSLWSSSGKHAVVEVALDATAGPYDSAPFLWIRSPGQLSLNWERMYGLSVGDEAVGVYDVDDDEALLFSSFDGNLTRI